MIKTGGIAMARTQGSTRVAMPRAKVFRMFQLPDLANAIPGIEEIEEVGDGKGFIVRLTGKGGGEETHVVYSGVEENRRIGWRSLSGARWNGDLVFRPVDMDDGTEGTEILAVIDFEPLELRRHPAPKPAVIPTWDIGGALLSFRYLVEGSMGELTTAA